MSDRSIAVTVAAEDKFDDWESTECRTPTSPSCRISEPITCPRTPIRILTSMQQRRNLSWEFTVCRTPTTPSCRLPEPTMCPPTPMISSLCHDFNATEEELELEFTECKTPTEPCCRISEPMTPCSDDILATP